MEQIVKIEERDGKQLVSARELHLFLEVKSRFNDWIRNRIDQYDLIEDVDHTKILVRSINRLDEYDYALTVSCAKELSMVENNEKGKQARRYFIDCEESLKKVVALGISPEHNMFSKRLDNIRKITEMREMNESDIDHLIYIACKDCGIKPDQYMLNFPDERNKCIGSHANDPYLINRYLSENQITGFNGVGEIYDKYVLFVYDLLGMKKKLITKFNFRWVLLSKGYNVYKFSNGAWVVDQRECV